MDSASGMNLPALSAASIRANLSAFHNQRECGGSHIPNCIGWGSAYQEENDMGSLSGVDL